jgi:hypothetical protein
MLFDISRLRLPAEGLAKEGQPAELKEQNGGKT